MRSRFAWTLTVLLVLAASAVGAETNITPPPVGENNDEPEDMEDAS